MANGYETLQTAFTDYDDALNIPRIAMSVDYPQTRSNLSTFYK